MLSKQWKSSLHSSLLPQHSIKSRVEPLNVPISRPEIQEEMCLTDGEQSGNEETDITDEHAQFLHSDIILKPHENIDLPSKEGTLQLHSPRVVVILVILYSLRKLLLFLELQVVLKVCRHLQVPQFNYKRRRKVYSQVKYL